MEEAVDLTYDFLTYDLAVVARVLTLPDIQVTSLIWETLSGYASIAVWFGSTTLILVVPYLEKSVMSLYFSALGGRKFWIYARRCFKAFWTKASYAWVADSSNLNWPNWEASKFSILNFLFLTNCLSCQINYLSLYKGVDALFYTSCVFKIFWLITEGDSERLLRTLLLISEWFSIAEKVSLRIR